jgi:glycosyltransferase involved in cell wall biosynthesis
MDAIAPLAGVHDFRLRFFGEAHRESEYGGEFFRRIERFPWASYEGMLGRPELKEWFTRATALILPSLEDNCPMTVLEAAAVGVPVMASRVGGIPDLVEDGVTGLLCDPLSTESMRNAFSTLLGEPSLRAKFAANGKAGAFARFKPSVVAGEHLRIYREVLQRRSKAV